MDGVIEALYSQRNTRDQLDPLSQRSLVCAQTSLQFRSPDLSAFPDRCAPGTPGIRLAFHEGDRDLLGCHDRPCRTIRSMVMVVAAHLKSTRRSSLGIPCTVAPNQE